MHTEYSHGKAWSITLLLFVFIAVNFIDKIAVGLLAVPIMSEFNLSPGQFGVVASSFFWLFAISGVVGGFIANKFPAKTILLTMALFWSLVQIPIAVSSSIAVLVIARVLLGVAEGPAFPVAVHACYKWFPDEKRTVPVALIAQGSGMGMLIAGMTIPLVTTHLGWRANFFVLAAVSIVWAVIWKLFGAEGDLDGNLDKRAMTTRSSPAEYRRLLSDRTVLGCFLFHFTTYWGLGLVLTWLPAYLQRGIGFDYVTSGRIFSAIVAMAVPLTLGACWLSQKMFRGMSSGRARGLCAAFVLVLCGISMMCLIADGLPPYARVLSIALAVGLSPAVYSWGPAMLAQIASPSQRGALLAMDNSFGSLAGIAAPIVSGYIISAIGGPRGYNLAFAFGGAVMLVGGLLGAVAVNPDRSALRMRESVQTGD